MSKALSNRLLKRAEPKLAAENNELEFVLSAFICVHLRLNRLFQHPAQALTLTIAALIPAAGILAQSPAPRPAFDAFEVATIKPAVDEQSGAFIKMQSAHRFYVKNYSLKSLVGAAYNLTPRAISGGPGWADSDHYDILAATPGEVQPNLDEQMWMLRKLLADRFKLTIHREQKEFSIYALTIAGSAQAAGPLGAVGNRKLGPKLKVSTAPPEKLPELVSVVFPDHVLMPARNTTIAEFASHLTNRGVLDRPVVDKTGITGKYDFDLEWADDETQFGGKGRKRASPDDGSEKPDFFAAIQQQLGLRLDATKGLIDVLVIDKVERPTEN
jgi:uncharacterized protein (TIGR03435 family)